jgi:uncharacterized protein (DUF2132 family)
MWGSAQAVQHFFKAKEGIVFCEDEKERVLSIDFVDSINITEKIAHMIAIKNLEELKNYFHSSLRFLRKVPFYTEDYEIEMEKAFETRRLHLTDFIVDQAKRHMEQQKDFRDLHDIFQDLMDRALEIGFTEEQKHRLIDLLELRKEQVRREKLEESIRALTKIQDVQELRDYWDSVKGYLLRNRPYLGSEFENLIAKRFDETMVALEERDDGTRGLSHTLPESRGEDEGGED